MIEPPGAPTILIADEDVGLVWWLGELLSELGYRSLPALSSADALSLLDKTGRQVDLLIVSPYLKGISRVIEALSIPGPLRLIFIEGPGGDKGSNLEPLAVLERPSGWGPISRGEWRQKLQRLLIQVGLRAAS